MLLLLVDRGRCLSAMRVCSVILGQPLYNRSYNKFHTKYFHFKQFFFGKSVFSEEIA